MRRLSKSEKEDGGGGEAGEGGGSKRCRSHKILEYTLAVRSVVDRNYS